MNSEELSRVSYTSRDYASILSDLMNAIPDLTTLWTSKDETDPGIVLVKLMSMVGDMLDYNLDKQSLEVYPGSVTQRKNAAQVFSLIGYKMHWYRSAECTVNISNSHTKPVIIPKYTKFITNNGKLIYTNMDEIQVVSGEGISASSTLVQGIPRTPNKINGIVYNPGQSWHSAYTYNISASDFIDNKYFFTDSAVDESHIVLVDNSGEEWEQVENLSLQIKTGKFFEFGVDEFDNPYIELISYQSKFGVDQFKLFYIVSDGFAGSISENTLTDLDSPVYVDDGTGSLSVANTFLTLYNYASTEGKDPETPDEARIESKNYVNTLDTLVTLDDFTNATKRLENVANAIALDCTNDPDPTTDAYQVNIYIVRQDESGDSAAISVFKEYIDTALRDYKMMPLALNIKVNEQYSSSNPNPDRPIDEFYWTVQGLVYLKEPVTTDKARDILTRINNQLRYSYGPSKVEFNSKLRYIDVVATIMAVDNLIYHVDLDPIKYYNYQGQEVSESLITGETTQVIPRTDNNQLKFEFTLTQVPIKPSSVSIYINNGNYIFLDNGNGKITCYTPGLLRSDGTIDYATGVCSFEVLEPLVADPVVHYVRNRVTITKYMNLSTESFNISTQSLKG